MRRRPHGSRVRRLPTARASIVIDSARFVVSLEHGVRLVQAAPHRRGAAQALLEPLCFDSTDNHTLTPLVTWAHRWAERIGGRVLYAHQAPIRLPPGAIA